MSERGQRIRLGLFVFGAVLALAALVVIFAKQPSWFTTKVAYQVVYDNATGVGPGTPVRRSGVKVGEVTAIELSDSSQAERKVIVRIRVDEKYVPRKSEVAAISQSLLSGDSAIDLIPDPTKLLTDQSPRLPDDTIPGLSPLSPRDVGQRAEPLINVTQQTLTQIRDSFQRFEKVAPELENTLREYALLSQTLRETVPEMRRTNDSVRALVDNANSSIPDLKRTNEMAQVGIRNWSSAGERVNVLIQTNEDKVVKTIDQLSVAMNRATDIMDKANKLFNEDNLKNVNDIIKNVKAASDEGTQLMKDSSKAVKRVNESADKFDATMENLKKASQPLADRADSLTRNIEETALQMQLVIKDIRALLQTYGRSDGTVQRLFTDPTLYTNANNAALQVSLMMPRLDRVLRDLETFADKLARHPELIGVRGAIKPDSGLKTSPTTPSTFPR